MELERTLPTALANDARLAILVAALAILRVALAMLLVAASRRQLVLPVGHAGSIANGEGRPRVAVAIAQNPGVVRLDVSWLLRHPKVVDVDVENRPDLPHPVASCVPKTKRPTQLRVQHLSPSLGAKRSLRWRCKPTIPNGCDSCPLWEACSPGSACGRCSPTASPPALCGYRAPCWDCFPCRSNPGCYDAFSTACAWGAIESSRPGAAAPLPAAPLRGGSPAPCPLAVRSGRHSEPPV